MDNQPQPPLASPNPPTGGEGGPPIYDQPPTTGKKPILIIGILLLLLIIITGAIYAAIKIAEKKNQSQTLSIAKNLTSPTKIQMNPSVVPTTDPTLGWKTYATIEYGFEFKYPSEYSLKEESISSGFDIRLIDSNGKIMLILTDSYNQGFGFGKKENKITDINKITWKIYSPETICDAGICEKSTVTYETQRNGKHYTLFLHNLAQDSLVFNQILPTFKFLSPSTSLQIPDAASETAGWEKYTNTKHGYSLKYPPTFEIVKGPVPESELPTLDNISFSGMKKISDSNAGVSLNILVNPSDAEGKSISCTTNDDCLQKLLSVLNKSSNEVINITNTIMGKSVKGFEYQNKNSLYIQTNQYFIYPDNGKIWQVNITISNYTTQEVISTTTQILSTFKFL